MRRALGEMGVKNGDGCSRTGAAAAESVFDHLVWRFYLWRCQKNPSAETDNPLRPSTFHCPSGFTLRCSRNHAWGTWYTLSFNFS